MERKKALAASTYQSAFFNNDIALYVINVMIFSLKIHEIGLDVGPNIPVKGRTLAFLG